MKPYFLQSMTLGARIIQPQGFEADKITQKTVFWSDGQKEAKRQKVGEWFASLEEAEQVRLKMIDYNILKLQDKINKLEILKRQVQENYFSTQERK